MTDRKQAPAPPPELPLDERVRDLICEQLSVAPDEVTPEAGFIKDLNADSLDMVELTMAMEEEFGFEISEEQAERLQTVGDALAFIEKQLDS